MVKKSFKTAEITVDADAQLISTSDLDRFFDDNVNDSDDPTDTDENLPLDILKLFHTDTEEEDFDGF